MEHITQMMNQFIEMQQKTQDYWKDFFNSSNKASEDYKNILNNSIKFHMASVDYHLSIVKMLEAIKDTQNILSKTK